MLSVCNMYLPCQSQYPIISIYELMYAEEDSFPPSELSGPVTQHEQQFGEKMVLTGFTYWEACVCLYPPQLVAVV